MKEMLFKMRLKGKRIFFRKDLFKHLSVGLKFQIFEHTKRTSRSFSSKFPPNMMIASALSSLQSYQYLPHHHLTLNKFTLSSISLAKSIDCVNKCESCKEINLEVQEI